MISREPILRVGILDHVPSVAVDLHGRFRAGKETMEGGTLTVTGESGGVHVESGPVTWNQPEPLELFPEHGGRFTLRDVVIGVQFHWERKEDQTFAGSLRVVPRGDGTVTAINDVPLEDYLTSVISSEMSAASPIELLRAHAVTSRSWLVAMLDRSRHPQKSPHAPGLSPDADEIIRWYTREDHDIFDVCADDHCQRYQGVSKISNPSSEAAIRSTRGMFLIHEDRVCDARYYKACGGRTEEFANSWEDMEVPYLVSVADGPGPVPPVRTEADAERLILSSPDVYCNTRDRELLRSVLPSFDQETTDFFRWTVRTPRREMEEILFSKSGIDIGTLMDLVPVERGPSGRLVRLKIVGTKRTISVGKDLEIRRLLSRSHLYSSAFVVSFERDGSGVPTDLALNGAGWGHGVGLCQIGAAVMASQGHLAEDIVGHYFRGAALRKLY